MNNQLFRLSVRRARTAACCACVLCAGPVTAATRHVSFPPVPAVIQAVSYASELSPRAASDPCQAYLAAALEQVRPGGGEAVAENPAGKAAALSLALGLRTVSGPLERVGSSPMRAELSPLNTPHVIAAPPLSAHAIAAYRQCRKEEALGQARSLARAGNF
ncbi:MAG: hypothetical protein ACT4OY_01455 [Alphaproteobacteria bacterium]